MVISCDGGLRWGQRRCAGMVMLKVLAEQPEGEDRALLLRLFGEAFRARGVLIHIGGPTRHFLIAIGRSGAKVGLVDLCGLGLSALRRAIVGSRMFCMMLFSGQIRAST